MIASHCTGGGSTCRRRQRGKGTMNTIVETVLAFVAIDFVGCVLARKPWYWLPRAVLRGLAGAALLGRPGGAVVIVRRGRRRRGR